MTQEISSFVLLLNFATTFFVTGVAFFSQTADKPVPESTETSSGGDEGIRKRLTHTWPTWTAWLLTWATAGILIWLAPEGIDAWLLWLNLFLLVAIGLSVRVAQGNHRSPSVPGSERISGATVESASRTPIVLSGMRAILVFWMAWLYTTSTDGGTMKVKLKVGDPAPAFTATTAEGQPVSLSDYVGKRGLVIFFYPKNGTSVCTKEACAFRDSYEKFVDADVEVIGVSSDSNASHQSFAGSHKLSYPLISDADGSLRKLFGVEKTLGLIPGRVTYVIDKQGIIRLIYSALLASDEHVQKALAAVGETSKPPKTSSTN